MMKYILLLVLTLAVFANAQNSIVGFIDDFTTDTDLLTVIIGGAGEITEFDSASTIAATSGSIAGEERDISIQANSGITNRIATTTVSGNEWQTALPNSVACTAQLQYDGIDGSPNLAAGGLNGLNLRDDNADSFRLTYKSDLDTEYIITVYDLSGATSTISVPVLGTSSSAADLQDGFFFYEDFVGSADFTNVGAIEVTLTANDNVDAVLGLFAISAPTVVPEPSIAPNPSALPSPDPVDDFEWYTFDDDDNGRSPCGDEPERRSYFLDDRGIVYYYFYGLEIDDDDDDDSAAVSVLVGSFSVIFAFVLALF